MKRFFTSLRQTAVAGFFFLFPVYVIFLVISKAWTSLNSIGSQLAALFGVKTLLGLGGAGIFSGLLIIVIWLACGLFMRLSFVGAFSKALDEAIANLIPRYASYRAIAEEKLEHKTRYASAFLGQHDCWQPAFLVEQDSNGSCVLFLPSIPETNKGQVLIAPRDQVRLVPSLSADELNMSLKRMGKGLLNACGHHRQSDT